LNYMKIERNIGKIDKAELFVVGLPLITPFVTGYGVLKKRESLLLKLTSDGYTGWSECASFRDPWYYYETIDSSIHVAVNYLLPELFTIGNLESELISKFFSGVKGHNMAKAMIENALLDIFARKRNKPLCDILGGNRKKIEAGISIGITKNIDTLIKKIEEAVKKKYHRVKIKIRKGWDAEVVSEVRSAFPNLNLTVDANGVYSPDDMGLLKSLDKFELKMIEQPFDAGAFQAHAELQKQVNTPICLDESIMDFYSASTAMGLNSCEIICIKQGRVGGIFESIKLKNYCIENGVKIWCGGMLETGIGRAYNLHLQTVDGFDFPGDTSESYRYFKEDIVTEPALLDSDGCISVPDGNGSGIEVDQKKLEKFLIYKKTIKR